jgi:hypothetical protein
MLDTHTSIYKPRSNKKSTTEEFIIKSRIIHGTKYDYSNVIYINSHSKISICCPFHGEFEQDPHSHLAGSGCPLCADEKHSRFMIKTKDEFVVEAHIKHENKYDYSKVIYKNSKSNITIICPIHGDFKQTPNSHLNGHGCPMCGNIKRIQGLIKTTDDFLESGIRIHGGTYDYSKVNYIKFNSPVTITCHIHGDFEQLPMIHLSGCGCPLCKSDKQRIRNAIRFEYTYPIGTLYFLRCYNDSEVFLKIGITSRTIEKRYNTNSAMPYEYETLYEWTGDSKVVVGIEQKIINQFVYYKPEIMFDGSHSETLHISQENNILGFLKGTLQ